VKVDRQITIDDNYMFTVTDTLTNSGGAAINVEPRAVLRQRMLPEHLKPAPQAHAGVIGTYGSQKNQMRTYKDLNKGKGVSQQADKGWIGLTTKYWMAAAVPEQGEPVTMLASVDKSNGRTMFNAGFTASSYSVQPGQSLVKTTRIFTGAKRVKVLDQYEHSGGIPAFTDAVDWSPFLFFITKPFFWLLQTFQGWFGSFGLAILALTVCVKTVFFPLQYKMYESMSKMRKLGPQVEAIKERFAADKARVQQETMKLYQTEKINPLAGCLPLIPQMFVFYSLYHTLVVTIEMRHTPFFGWIKDMSAPDPTTIFNLFGLLPFNPGAIPVVGSFLMIGVWPILYGATMFALQSLSPPPADPTQRMIMKWIPLVFLILFAGVASGLAIYWVWSNLITLTQQYIIMRRTGVETELDKLLKKFFGKKSEAA
jgi:YidC/Oxa1 family membrane protein insertase